MGEEWGFRLAIGGMSIVFLFCIMMLILSIIEVLGVHSLWLFIGVPVFLFAAWFVGGVLMTRWDK